MCIPSSWHMLLKSVLLHYCIIAGHRPAVAARARSSAEASFTQSAQLRRTQEALSTGCRSKSLKLTLAQIHTKFTIAELVRFPSPSNCYSSKMRSRSA